MKCSVNSSLYKCERFGQWRQIGYASPTYHAGVSAQKRLFQSIILDTRAQFATARPKKIEVPAPN